MKNHFILILICLITLSAHARSFSSSEVPWLPQLTEKKITGFHICGSAKILPTLESLSTEFILDPEKSGYFFTNMMPLKHYKSILITKNLTDAKTALEKEFKKSHLYKYTAAKGLEDIGPPTKIEFPFTATIKDCVEGAKTTLGTDCSHFKFKELQNCCGEKFSGPRLLWGNHEKFQLMYSPDPSVRLKVPSEKKHRYCNFEELITLK